jgi:glycosyltransferase involved in cell wall biosynthesis
VARSKTIVFIANDMPFFFRHFSPAIDAAIAVQAKVYALLPRKPQYELPPRFDGALDVIEMQSMRRRPTYYAFGYQIMSLISELRRLAADIVVSYSIRSIVVTIIAFPFLRAKQYVFVVTGLGTMDVIASRKARVFKFVFYQLMRWANRSSKVCFIFENRSDPIRIGISLVETRRHLILMGAGVDPQEFRPEPKPPVSPLRLATVGRLIWSKGTDIAVEAVLCLIREGYKVSLDIFGSPDLANPLPVEEATIAAWMKSSFGVRYHGQVEDVPGIWREHHLGIFPTRGGEGLPRALLEAAASGVPTIVTDVPGCQDFVRHGSEGFVVQPESVKELASAIKRFIHDPQLLVKFGKASRDRVLETATSEIVKQKYILLFSCGAESP